MNKQTAQWIEKHFDTAFAAPDGIKKLRELILTLAMQGRLVPQDPNDQPASELLTEIAAERRRLVKEGKIKAAKPLPEISAEDVPYGLPVGWVWVRLDFIADYNGRKNIDTGAIDSDEWLLDLEDIEKDTSRIIYRAKYSERQSKSTKSIFKKGDVLYGKLRPYLNKVVVADSDGVCTTEIVPIVPFTGINSDFLRWLLKRPAFLMHVNSLMYGVKMPRLGTDDAVRSIHPLPPIPEQCRIVAKIDQLMARCDELEKLRAEQVRKRLTVHTSAIKRLLDAQAKNSFDEAWQFITRHFGTLYSVKGNVTELRKAILQLAMEGKLSSPLDTDMPITLLIQRLQIEQEKNPSIKQKEKDSIFNKLNAALNNVMNSRVDLEAITFCEFVTKGTTPSANELTTSGDIPFIKVYNIVNNTLDFDYKPSYVSLSVHRNRLKRSIIFPGDVIMNIVGPPLGKVAIITDQYPEWNMNQALAVFRPLGGINNRYIYYALSTDSVLESVLSDVKGTAGQDNLSLEQCRTIVIPIPSIEEQHRIIAKIDQLISLCDALEQQIDAAAGKQTKLLSALMAQV